MNRPFDIKQLDGALAASRHRAAGLRPQPASQSSQSSIPSAALLDARTIVAGSYRPWCFDSSIASKADWLMAAQCALDGDDRDLTLFLEQLEANRASMTLPEDEHWKHERIAQ